MSKLSQAVTNLFQNKALINYAPFENREDAKYAFYDIAWLPPENDATYEEKLLTLLEKYNQKPSSDLSENAGQIFDVTMMNLTPPQREEFLKAFYDLHQEYKVAYEKGQAPQIPAYTVVETNDKQHILSDTIKMPATLSGKMLQSIITNNNNHDKDHLVDIESRFRNDNHLSHKDDSVGTKRTTITPAAATTIFEHGNKQSVPSKSIIKGDGELVAHTDPTSKVDTGTYGDPASTESEPLSKYITKYNNTSRAFKVVTAPNRACGIMIGTLFKWAAQAITRDKQVSDFQYQNLSTIIPYAATAITDTVTSHAGAVLTTPISATAVSNVTTPLLALWGVASMITDAFSGFKALQAGMNEAFGRVRKNSGPTPGMT